MHCTIHGTSTGSGVILIAPLGLHYNIRTILKSPLSQFWNADAKRNSAVWNETCPDRGLSDSGTK